MEGRANVLLDVRAAYGLMYVKTFMTILEEGENFNINQFFSRQDIRELKQNLELKDSVEIYIKSSTQKIYAQFKSLTAKNVSLAVECRKSLINIFEEILETEDVSKSKNILPQLLRAYIDLKKQKNVLKRLKEGQAEPIFELKFPENLKEDIKKRKYAQYTRIDILMFLYLQRENRDKKIFCEVQDFFKQLKKCNDSLNNNHVSRINTHFKGAISTALQKDASTFNVFSEAPRSRDETLDGWLVRLSEYFYNIRELDNGRKEAILDMEKIIIASDALEEMFENTACAHSSLINLIDEFLPLQADIIQLEKERAQVMKESLNLLIKPQISVTDALSLLLTPQASTNQYTLFNTRKRKYQIEKVDSGLNNDDLLPKAPKLNQQQAFKFIENSNASSCQNSSQVSVSSIFVKSNELTLNEDEFADITDKIPLLSEQEYNEIVNSLK